MGIRAALTSVYMAWLTKSNLKKVRDPAKVAKRHTARLNGPQLLFCFILTAIERQGVVSSPCKYMLCL